MLVDRSATKPRAWPPASDSVLVLEQLRCAMLRDRFGHWCQTIFACIFAFASAINHAPLNIASGMLISCFLIRLHATWRAMPTLLRAKALIPCTLLSGWMLLSLLWSSASSHAMSDLSMLRWLILLPALWPVLDHARAIAIAFILGTAVQNGVQFLQLADLWERPAANPWRHAGIVDHPGDSALRSAMSVALALSLALTTRSVARMLLLLAAIAALLGVFITAGRGQILALCVALPLLLALLFRGGFISRRAIVITATSVLLICAIALPTVGQSTLRYFNEVPAQLTDAANGTDSTTPVAARVHWWNLAVKLWSEHALVGAGLGSYEVHSQATAQNIVNNPSAQSSSHTEHPHNAYLSVLTEGGIIGFVLFAWLLCALLREGWSNARQDPLACGALSALVVVLVAALTSDPQYREMGVSSAMIVVALGCLPWIRGWRS